MARHAFAHEPQQGRTHHMLYALSARRVSEGRLPLACAPSCMPRIGMQRLHLADMRQKTHWPPPPPRLRSDAQMLHSIVNPLVRDGMMIASG